MVKQGKQQQQQKNFAIGNIKYGKKYIGEVNGREFYVLFTSENEFTYTSYGAPATIKYRIHDTNNAVCYLRDDGSIRGYIGYLNDEKSIYYFTVNIADSPDSNFSDLMPVYYDPYQ